MKFFHLESQVAPRCGSFASVWCRQHPADSFYKRLIGAIERGERAEISASPGLDDPDAPRDTIDFVLDGKKLVKLTMSAKDAADATKIFAPPSRESAIPAGNRAGEKWVNHLTVWEAPDVYATLYQDNNATLQDRRPVLVVESRAEHVREDGDSAVRTDPPR